MVRVYLKAESLVMACRMLDPSLAVGRMTYASICDRPSANATLNHPNGPELSEQETRDSGSIANRMGAVGDPVRTLRARRRRR